MGLMVGERIKILLVLEGVECAHWLAKALARNEDFVVDWSADALLADRRLLLLPQLSCGKAIE